MDIGAMREEIVLQFMAEVQAVGSGEVTLAVDTTATVWAQWFPQGTNETWQAQQKLEGVIDGVFRIYFRTDINPATTQIVWNEKTFDVKPPIDNGWRDYLDVPVVAHA